jgi:signal transduction histidine kinase
MTSGIRFPRFCCTQEFPAHRGPDPEGRFEKRSEAIRRAALRMNSLIQDLLDVAVMESGQLTIKPARLSAPELIGAAVDMQRPLCSSSSLELRVDVGPDVPDVWVIGIGSFKCSRT